MLFQFQRFEEALFKIRSFRRANAGNEQPSELHNLPKDVLHFESVVFSLLGQLFRTKAFQNTVSAVRCWAELLKISNVMLVKCTALSTATQVDIMIQGAIYSKHKA